MKQLEKQIKWYEKKWNGFYKADIVAELRRLNQLYDEVEGFENEFFVDRLIDIFCETIETQRDKIAEFEMRVEQKRIELKKQHNFIALDISPESVFKTDEQLQKAFNYYLTNEVRKPLSSYTINDYCSRIKILFNTFLEECKKGSVPEEIHPSKEALILGNPLLNAYNNIQELQIHLDMKIRNDSENRNLTNARAALNKFEKFKLSLITKR